jgi:hypothetical protein
MRGRWFFTPHSVNRFRQRIAPNMSYEEAERKADEGKAALASELRELLSAFIDAAVLPGHVITDEQRERACLLCGRWCPPFVNGGKK